MESGSEKRRRVTQHSDNEVNQVFQSTVQCKGGGGREGLVLQCLN